MTSTAAEVRAVLAFLKRRGSRRNREGMARFGIVSKHVMGVSVADLRIRARAAGKDHALALALWKTGVYEARMLAGLVDEPSRVTPAQMDRWARAFDNWAICDNSCLHLFDKTPYAWTKIHAWSRRREEFVKRAAFALLASVAAHHKTTPDAPFLRALTLIERESRDGRNYVKKGVSWALRTIGHRNPRLKASALSVARRLAASPDAARRWIGRDAVKDLTR